MRVLLDENFPRALQLDLVGHDVSTVTQMGWSGMPDRDLLRRAGDHFDVLITADRNLEFHQNVAAASIGIVVVAAPNTRLQTLQPLIPSILTAVRSVRRGNVLTIS